jgi:tungstate transport system substrate-binding protein
VVKIALLLLALVALGCGGNQEGSKFITIASTTSPENSGLHAVLLPKFEKATGIEVRAMPVGTGKAIRIARDGNADAVFVHNEGLERQFVADGHGVERLDVMKNEFVIVGPGKDPAEIARLEDGAEALRRIAEASATFVSRGDDSGTHRRELAIWKRSGIDPRPASGRWYQEAGAGMGATLNVAVAKGAYCLTDSSTWGAFKNKGELEVLVRGDPKLENPYTFIVVSKIKHPSAKQELAQKLADWLTGPDGQAVIRDFRVGGEQLFTPAAGGSN